MGIRKTKVGVAILLVSDSHITHTDKRLIKSISGATKIIKVVPRTVASESRLLFQGKISHRETWNTKESY